MSLTKNVAIIAPEQLQHGLTVLINSIPSLCLHASATRVDKLAEFLGEEKPDVILLYLPTNSEQNLPSPGDQIDHVRSLWPDIHCIGLARFSEELESFRLWGADVVLRVGVEPEKLLEAIRAIENLKNDPSQSVFNSQT